MTPKLNVLKLQTERRYEKIEGKRRLVEVLVLRDQQNAVIQIAKTPLEQTRLKRSYRQYSLLNKAEELPVQKQARNKLAITIANLRERGFTYSYIRHGTTRNKKTGRTQYKRIEIFKATPWTYPEKTYIRNYFRFHIPVSNLTVFVYHNHKLYTTPPRIKKEG